MNKTALQQIEDLAPQVPHNILLDIHQRIGDWLANGGGEDDSYIYQQLDYAKRVVMAKEQSA